MHTFFSRREGHKLISVVAPLRGQLTILTHSYSFVLIHVLPNLEAQDSSDKTVSYH